MADRGESARVWVVTWELPFEDGGFSSVWTTEDAALTEAHRRRSSDGIGAHWSVCEVHLDQPQTGNSAPQENQ